MLKYNLPRNLPSADELPDSDETPVDNELQELIPGLLKAILRSQFSFPLVTRCRNSGFHRTKQNYRTAFGCAFVSAKNQRDFTKSKLALSYIIQHIARQLCKIYLWLK